MTLNATGNPLDALSGAHTRNTVVVLGASYAGNRAVNVLVQHLPPGWRVIVLERNTHANHLYAFPRMAILPNQAHKVFIPYTNIFGSSLPSHSPSTSYPHLLIHGSLTSISATKGNSRGHLYYVPMDPNSNTNIQKTQRIDFDFCVYALGSHLPPPINIWSGPGPLPIQKQEENQDEISSSNPNESSSVTLARKNLLDFHNHNHPDSPPSDQETDLTTDSSSSQSADDLMISSSEFSSKIDLKNSDRHQNKSSNESFGMDSSSSYSSFSSDRGENRSSPHDKAGLLPLSPPSSKHPSNASLRSSAALRSSSDSSSNSTSISNTSSRDDGITHVQMPLCRGTKKEGMAWLEDARKKIDEASSVLVIGGGALGVQFASDIAEYYTGNSSKHVTLAHSGQRLLPRFDSWMHNQTHSILTKLGVHILLGSRIDLNSIGVHEELNSKTNEMEIIRTVKTLDGRRVKAELILFCTGQTPNTKFLKDLLPNTVDERTGMAKINRSMQLAWSVEPDEEEVEVAEENLDTPSGNSNSTSIRLGGGGGKKKKKTLWKLEGDHDWPHALASPNEYTPFPPPPETCVSPAKRNESLPNTISTTTNTNNTTTNTNNSNSTSTSNSNNNQNNEKVSSNCSLQNTNPSSSNQTEINDSKPLNSGEALPITPEPKVALPNIFVIGDAADAFGALKAGHTAWTQAEVASRNICRIIASGPSPSSSSSSTTHSNSNSNSTKSKINSSSSLSSSSGSRIISTSSKTIINSTTEEKISNPNLPHQPFTPCSHDCACMETLDEEASKGVQPSKSSIPKVAISEGGNGKINEGVSIKDEDEDEFEQWRKRIEVTIGKDRLEKYHPPPPSIKVSLGLTCALSQSSGRYSIKGPEECPLDLNAPSMWTRRGLSQEDMMI